MKIKQSTPFAPFLIESMRSLGYSFETAIADLIDNSVSASAKKINILLDPSDDPRLVIFDDGHGMDSVTLEESLRFGSYGPLNERDEHDLGRFGLGMKSASLSQCRKLIVASKHKGVISCFSWDLDKVDETQNWSVIEYSGDEIRELSNIELLDSVNSGTYISLQNFDRISVTSSDVVKTIKKSLELTEDHLALVFHRIMSEDDVTISINGRPIEPKDPFLENHKSTQRLREQTIVVDESKITLQPYILPHRNKLTSSDLKKVGGSEDLRTHQGFYIYRCKRLILWGTWFRLLSKDELNKLARVKVDIPNSLDEIWSIDVKKSSANLPDRIRKNLYGSIRDSVFGSKKVIEHRGKLNRDDDINYIWQRLSNRDGGVIYQINRGLPQIELLNSILDSESQQILEVLLQNIEQNFPASSVYLDVADGEVNEIVDDIDALLHNFESQLEYARKMNMTKQELAEILLKTEPYSKYDSLKEIVKKKWSNHEQ